MNKPAIKNFAVWARRKLISDITYRAGTLGITENGIAEKLPQSTSDLHFYDIGTKNYIEVSGTDIDKRNTLVSAIRRKEADTGNYTEAFQYVVEEVAYTWFNRLIAIRFMEVNDYLPSGIRVLSSENPAKTEPDFVTSPFETDLDFTTDEQDRVIQLKDENKLDELFRMLFIKQCNKLHDILPELFEKTNDYSELLLALSFTDKDGVVYHLVHDIPEDDFNIEKEGQVEIIGWMYQYYNTEPKDAVFANLKKNIKISKEHIPAATQLFTPDWIVRYMVENSLGRLWLDGHSDSNVKAQWQYYLEEAEQEESVKAQLEELRREYKNLSPEDIKFIDPCMGSGHILVYAFEVFMQIYSSYGYVERDAAQLIVRKNLYGLDIDERAYQLAYFAVMMKARQYDRRFFTREIKPNLAHFQGFDSVQPDYARGAVRELAERFIHCDTYGSLIEMPEIKGVEEAAAEFEGVIGLDVEKVERMLPIYKILSQKYDVVCTNPPYMRNRGMNNVLAKFIKKKYTDYKFDLYSAFIKRCYDYIKANGYMSMITQHSFMFLSRFEANRNDILSTTISNMVHLGTKAFEEIGGEVVQTVAFALNKHKINNYLSKFVRLTEVEKAADKETAFFERSNHYKSSSEKFLKIPGNVFAYWISDRIVQTYENSKIIDDVAYPRKGNSTSDNDRFLRFWYEIQEEKMNLNATKIIREDTLTKRWFPYNKGGGYRKWYGNNEYLVDWYNDAAEIRKIPSAVIANYDFFTVPGVTWSTISGRNIGVRKFGHGFIFDNKGESMFFNSPNQINYFAGFLNSTVCMAYLSFLSPTLDFNCGYISKLPIIITDDKALREQIDIIVEENVSICRTDWDSFETSWDFKKHPLI